MQQSIMQVTTETWTTKYGSICLLPQPCMFQGFFNISFKHWLLLGGCMAPSLQGHIRNVLHTFDC
jgi:hypothetical protein